jgi:hypothetical protein
LIVIVDTAWGGSASDATILCPTIAWDVAAAVTRVGVTASVTDTMGVVAAADLEMTLVAGSDLWDND